MKLSKTLFLLTFVNVCGMFSSLGGFCARRQNEARLTEEQVQVQIVEMADRLIEKKSEEQRVQSGKKKTRGSAWVSQRREQSDLASVFDSSSYSSSYSSDSSDLSISYNPFDPLEPSYSSDPFVPASPFDLIGPFNLSVEWVSHRREQSDLASVFDSSSSSSSSSSLSDSSDLSISYNPFDPLELSYSSDPFTPASPFDLIGLFNLSNQMQ